MTLPSTCVIFTVAVRLLGVMLCDRRMTLLCCVNLLSQPAVAAMYGQAPPEIPAASPLDGFLAQLRACTTAPAASDMLNNLMALVVLNPDRCTGVCAFYGLVIT